MAYPKWLNCTALVRTVSSMPPTMTQGRNMYSHAKSLRAPVKKSINACMLVSSLFLIDTGWNDAYV